MPLYKKKKAAATLTWTPRVDANRRWQVLKYPGAKLEGAHFRTSGKEKGRNYGGGGKKKKQEQRRVKVKTEETNI